MKTLIKISQILILFLASLSLAELRPLSENEMREVSAPNLVQNYNLFRQSVSDFLNQPSQNVDSQKLADFLENQANIFGLHLKNVTINGVTYIDGAATLEIQVDSVPVAVSNLPAHIDSIEVEAITVNGSSPSNASFGSISIRDINFTGTHIYINTSSNGQPPGLPVIPHH